MTNGLRALWQLADREGRLHKAAQSYIDIIESLWRTDTPRDDGRFCDRVTSVTQEEWHGCQDPLRMVAYLAGRASDRKLRLWACAYWRGSRSYPSTSLELSEAVVGAENFADGLVSKRELSKWRAFCVAARTGAGAADSTANWAAYQDGVIACSLIRHLFGDPYHPYARPESWPTTVVRLADSLYAGSDVVFALIDALLDAGHPDLAEHFRQETEHPKGCWVLDMVTGRE